MSRSSYQALATFWMVACLCLAASSSPSPAAATSRPASPASQATARNAVVVVLDESGSMLGNDPDYLRRVAANLLVDLASQGDLLGIVFFADDVAESDARFAMVTDEASRQQFIDLLKNRRPPREGLDHTNTIDGLEKAWQYLKDVPATIQRRAVILLTDGDLFVNQELFREKYPNQTPDDAFDEKVAALKEIQAEIFPIGLIADHVEVEEKRRLRARLANLRKETGTDKFAYRNEAREPTELLAAYAEVAAILMPHWYQARLEPLPGAGQTLVQFDVRASQSVKQLRLVLGRQNTGVGVRKIEVRGTRGPRVLFQAGRPASEAADIAVSFGKDVVSAGLPSAAPDASSYETVTLTSSRSEDFDGTWTITVDGELLGQVVAVVQSSLSARMVFPPPGAGVPYDRRVPIGLQILDGNVVRTDPGLVSVRVDGVALAETPSMRLWSDTYVTTLAPPSTAEPGGELTLEVLVGGPQADPLVLYTRYFLPLVDVAPSQVERPAADNIVATGAQEPIVIGLAPGARTGQRLEKMSVSIGQDSATPQGVPVAPRSCGADGVCRSEFVPKPGSGSLVALLYGVVGKTSYVDAVEKTFFVKPRFSATVLVNGQRDGREVEGDLRQGFPVSVMMRGPFPIREQPKLDVELSPGSDEFGEPGTITPPEDGLRLVRPTTSQGSDPNVWGFQFTARDVSGKLVEETHYLLTLTISMPQEYGVLESVSLPLTVTHITEETKRLRAAQKAEAERQQRAAAEAIAAQERAAAEALAAQQRLELTTKLLVVCAGVGLVILTGKGLAIGWRHVNRPRLCGRLHVSGPFSRNMSSDTLRDFQLELGSLSRLKYLRRAPCGDFELAPSENGSNSYARVTPIQVEHDPDGLYLRIDPLNGHVFYETYHDWKAGRPATHLDYDVVSDGQVFFLDGFLIQYEGEERE